jgi:hypothetical protein
LGLGRIFVCVTRIECSSILLCSLHILVSDDVVCFNDYERVFKGRPALMTGPVSYEQMILLAC